MGGVRVQGKVSHSQAFRSAEGYEGRRVLLIGIGNSALDSAIELARSTAKEVPSSLSFPSL